LEPANSAFKPSYAAFMRAASSSIPLLNSVIRGRAEVRELNLGRCGAGVKAHSDAGVCVELPARSCGRLGSRFPDSALYDPVDLRRAGRFCRARHDQTIPKHWATTQDRSCCLSRSMREPANTAPCS
jgi:hypothetical protein